jgi:molybdate transport system ATP-binding protein
MIKIDIVKKLHGSNGDMKLRSNLLIKKGEFIALSAESGSGKTTLLRIIAGLESASGVIEVDGDTWLKDGKSLAPQHRDIGFVFQEYALFSNMSVRENLLYVNKDEKFLRRLLDMTNLCGLEDRVPATLSGGQKQRVALCRALMGRPKLLLMDEPLSAIDTKMRLKLQNEIKALHKEFKTTTIMVTHDKSEIYRLADRVLMIEDGLVKEVCLKKQSLDEFELKGEVLDIVKDGKKYILTLLVYQDIVNVTISKEEAKTLRIGQNINISSSNLLLNF